MTGYQLKALRIALGYSQAKLGQVLHRSQVGILKMEQLGHRKIPDGLLATCVEDQAILERLIVHAGLDKPPPGQPPERCEWPCSKKPVGLFRVGELERWLCAEHETKVRNNAAGTKVRKLK